MCPHRAPTSLIAMLAVAAATPRALALLLLTALPSACGGSSRDAGGATRAPASSGDVWVVSSPDDRASTPGAVLAYVHGLHTFVLDGDDAYLGMTHLTARKGPDGARVLTLPGGGDVRLVEAGANLELRFPGGETLLLQKQGSAGR